VTNAAQYFFNKGGVVVMSAGNNATFDPSADNPYVLTVSATDSTDAITSWSNTGNLIDVAAPGDWIYTTNNGGGYGAWAGTSFSAPITAGVAALVMSANPNLSPAQVQNIVKTSADDLGTAGWDARYGAGRVNASRAVNQAFSTGSAPGDSAPPTVSFSSPSNGSTVSGVLSVQVSASDNVGVSSVSLSIDGSSLGSDTTAPYSFSLNTASYNTGNHTLTATARDAAGNTSSASITINVSNVSDTVPPVPLITAPSNGGTVSGNVVIYAMATDNVKVTKIELYVDNVLKNTSNGSTAQMRWNTKQASAGVHTLKARALDAAGNSASVSITVTKQ
jgi:thermitase